MRILIYCPGFEEKNIDLQPWKYFFRIGQHLFLKGYDVKILTRKKKIKSQFEFERNGILNCKNISHEYKNIDAFIQRETPSVLISSIGPLCSIIGNPIFEYNGIGIGVISYPIYSIREIFRTGSILIREYRKIYQHAIGAIIRNFTIYKLRRISNIVVESIENKKRLLAYESDLRDIWIIYPGVDKRFFQYDFSDSHLDSIHKKPIISFLGSANPLRGPFDLIKIWERVLEKNNQAELRLLIRPDNKEEKNMIRIYEKSKTLKNIYFTGNKLSQESIISHLVESKVVIFPFRLIPSDMPIGPLEALICGSIVIVPKLNGLGELEKFGALSYEHANLDSMLQKILSALNNKEKGMMNVFRHITLSWEGAANKFEEIIMKYQK